MTSSAPPAAGKVPRPPKFYNVPTHAQFSVCSCGVRQYWIETAKGGKMPVNCAVEGGVLPQIVVGEKGAEHVTGRGINHFEDCPDRERYRKRGKSE